MNTKLNLGCGNKKLVGYVNCDIDLSVNPDIILDFNKPFLFWSKTFDEVLMSHSLEHGADIGKTLSECFHVTNKVVLLLPAPCSKHYVTDKHTFTFSVCGLRGRNHRFIPRIIQRLLGCFIPSEYLIIIKKIKK